MIAEITDFLLSFLLPIFQDLYDLIQSVLDYFKSFFNDEIYPLITKTIAEFIKAAMIQKIEFEIFAIGFCWDIAKDLLITLNISPAIEQAWGMLDSKLLQFLTFFRIPEGVNLLVSAYATRFVYKFIGF